ncbi:MAG: putative acetyltransferase [Gemmatimonadetes bacterium]|nr:putative acetyltransferase [Gemmatimonadota bacterium]
MPDLSGTPLFHAFQRITLRFVQNASKWSYDDLSFVRLSSPAPAEFDCGSAAQNDFLLRHALTAHEEQVSATYLGYLAGQCFGYVTLAPDSLETLPRERPRRVKRWPRIPALKILQMATDLRFQGRGLGSALVQFAVFVGCEADRVPYRYLTLDAVPERVGWYQRRGFTVSELRQRERIARLTDAGGDPGHLPVSMHMDLRDARSAR